MQPNLSTDLQVQILARDTVVATNKRPGTQSHDTTSRASPESSQVNAADSRNSTWSPPVKQKDATHTVQQQTHALTEISVQTGHHSPQRTESEHSTSIHPLQPTQNN